MMRPPRRMTGKTAWAMKVGPRTLTLKFVAKSAGVRVVKGPRMAMPALLTVAQGFSWFVS